MVQKVRLANGSKEMVPIEDSLLEDQDLVLEIQDIMASIDSLDSTDQEQETAKMIGIAIDRALQQDHHNLRIFQDALDVGMVTAIKLH